MAKLWSLPDEAPFEVVNLPSPVRVIEVTPWVRAKDEADRADRERLRLSEMSWRRPDVVPEPVPHVTELTFPAGSANRKHASLKGRRKWRTN